MGAEQRETQVIEQFVKRASDIEGSSLVDLIIQATSHSSLFAFSEILAVPSVVEELDISNVRELEDFLINECINVGIVRGKLNQLQKCFEVQFAAGRDLRPGKLASLIQTLTNWLSTSDKMLLTIKEMIDRADRMKELDKEHQKEVEEKIELAKKFLQHKPSIKLGPLEDIDMLYMAGVMSSGELGSHSKRKRTSI